LDGITSVNIKASDARLDTFFFHDLANSLLTQGNYIYACMWHIVLLPHAAALLHKGNILSKGDSLFLSALGTLLEKVKYEKYVYHIQK